MSGVPVKARNSAFGQRRAHVQRQRVVLAAVRFVGQDDDVAPIAEHLRRLELVDQGEDVAMIPAQQVAQMRAALRVALVAFASLTAPVALNVLAI